MNNKETNNQTDTKQSVRDEWFENFIHHIKTDQTFINLGIASNDTQNLYDKLIFGNVEDLMKETKDKTTRYYVGKLVVDYIKMLKELSVNPNSLYLDYNDSQVLVWAEINDNDEVTEDNLFRAEGKANALNHDSGFHISSTILEASDKAHIPPHYQKLEIHK